MMRVMCRQVLKQNLSDFDMIPDMCSAGGRIEHEIDNMTNKVMMIELL